MHPEGAL